MTFTRFAKKQALLLFRTGLAFLFVSILLPTNTESLKAAEGLVSSAINVKDFGARGNGATDDTHAIQEALNAGPRVFFPAGVYSVKSSHLQLNDDAFIYGEGMSTVIVAAKGRPNVQDNIIKAVDKHNITVDSLSFFGVDSKQTALLFASCSRVRVTHCRSRNCQLVYVGSSAVRDMRNINTPNGFFDIYGFVTKASHYSSDIIIESNLCLGDLTADSPADGKNLSALFVSFAKNVRIVNNDISQYFHGITWWGGNANTKGPVPNGDIANERKCQNITITGNNIHSIRAGGIWGSMGQGVAIAANTVTGCGDVGIDFEGCINCTATGNTVEDCHTACLCTCFDNKGITFSGNACTQHTPGSFIVYVQNLHGSTGNQDVNFSGNALVATKGMSAVVSQGIQHLMFQGNTLRNVHIHFASPQLRHHAQIVSNNDMYFDTKARKPFGAVKVGGLDEGGYVSVVGNVISTRVSQPDGSTGIDLLTSAHSAQNYLIANNVVAGWSARDILIQALQPSGSGTMNLIKLSGNIISGFSVDRSVAGGSRILDESNTKTSAKAMR